MSKTLLGLQNVRATFEVISLINLYLSAFPDLRRPNRGLQCSKLCCAFCLRETYTEIEKSEVCGSRGPDIPRQQALRSSAVIWLYPHPSRMLAR